MYGFALYTECMYTKHTLGKTNKTRLTKESTKLCDKEPAINYQLIVEVLNIYHSNHIGCGLWLSWRHTWPGGLFLATVGTQIENVQLRDSCYNR